jgi:DNA repair protein RadD
MSAPELRPYQRDVIAEFDRTREHKRRIILVAPTGAGKTVIGADIIRSYVRRAKSVLVLAHRREIIAQTSGKLRAAEVSHGIIQAGFHGRPLELVQVASIQTLWARAIHRGTMDLPPVDLLVVDECHHTPAGTYRKIIDAYPNATLLGLTATPCRGDGRGLGGIFETIIECPQVAQLIEQGHLVRTRVYAPVDPDLRGVKVQAGDYVETQLAERMDRPKLIGDIVTHWHKFSERRKTVAFACSVAHSIHIRDEFVKSGVRAEHIDGATPKAERDASLERLANGEIELVSNCMVLTEGWDLPAVGCCILARPTKKMGLYRQMIGRVLRPAGGKPDAIILDHSGAVYRHGFAEDRVDWTLSPDRRAKSPTHKQRCTEHSSRLLECTQCGAIRTAA